MATKSAKSKSTKPRVTRIAGASLVKPATSARSARSTSRPEPHIPAPLGKAGSAVKTGIGSSLEAMTRAEEEIVVLVRTTVAGTLRAAGSATDELVAVIRDVVAGAVQASEQAGTSLAASARSIAKGIMLGVNEVGGNIAAAATETVRTVVKHATAVGTDVSAIARNTVAGVVDATIETGRDVTHIAATSVKDAIKASGRIGSRTARRVENILAGVVRGAKEAVNVAPAPAPGGRTTKVTARAGAPARKAPAKKLANRLAA